MTNAALNVEQPASPNPEQNPDTVAGESAIESLINQANEAEHHDPDARGFMEPKTSTKGKGGRKRKNPDDPKWARIDAQKAQGPNPQGNTSQPGGTATPPPNDAKTMGADFSIAIRGLFAVGSNALVKATKCPDVALSDEELKSLGDVWGAVAAKYMPQYLNDHAELVSAIVVTGAIGLRIHNVMEKEIARRQAEKAKRDAANTFEGEVRTL